MKIFTKLSAIFVVLALLLSCFAFSVFAKESATLHFSKNSIEEGEDITVSVAINPDVAMSNVSFYLKYDAEVLAYVEGDGTKDSDGVLSIDKKLSNEKSVRCDFTFSGIKAGISTITVSDCLYVTKKGDTSAEKKFVGASAVVNVKEAKLTQNTKLKSLSIGEYKLSPKFSADKTSYTAKVPYDVEEIEVVATPANEKSKVKIEGNDKLKVGENKITVTVEATNGKKNKYTIIVTREKDENATAEEENDQETVTGTGLETTIDGKPYVIMTTIPESALFDGFKIEKTDVNGYTVDTAVDEGVNFRIFYLKAEGSDTLLPYLYDVGLDLFQPLKCLTIGDNTYIIQELPEELTYPDNLYPSNIEIGEYSVECLADTNTETNAFKYLYCFFNGQYNVYRYDTQENTLQRYPELENATFATTSSDEGFLDRFGTLSTNGKVIVIALFVVVLGIIALLLLLVVYLIRRAMNRNQDFVLYDDDDDFDEVDIKNNNNTTV